MDANLTSFLKSLKNHAKSKVYLKPLEFSSIWVPFFNHGPRCCKIWLNFRRLPSVKSNVYFFFMFLIVRADIDQKLWTQI